MEHKEKMREEMVKNLLGFANETGIAVTGIDINWVINTDTSGQRDPIFVVSDIKFEAKIH